MGEGNPILIEAEGMSFDVVVSDMAMPGELDGLGLAEYLRAHHPHVPVVLMTGYASQLHEAAARKFTVLAKPCAPEVLISTVRSALLAQRRASAEHAPPVQPPA